MNMPRPSLAARPMRDVSGVVADMLGETGHPSKPELSGAEKTLPVETVKPPAVETASDREKTSFALRPDIKRRLTLLKLDLRAADRRITEAEIVEALIASADLAMLKQHFPPRKNTRS